MTEKEQLARITARLKGLAYVEDVSGEVGFAAIRTTRPDGSQRVDTATSTQQYLEWIANLQSNHRDGFCIFADYDSEL